MFRFTIRDVLWLMLVVGMGAGWFLHVRAERRLREAEIQELTDEFEKGKAIEQKIVKRLEELRALAIEKVPELANELGPLTDPIPTPR